MNLINYITSKDLKVGEYADLLRVGINRVRGWIRSECLVIDGTIYKPIQRSEPLFYEKDMKPVDFIEKTAIDLAISRGATRSKALLIASRVTDLYRKGQYKNPMDMIEEEVRRETKR